MSSSRHWTDSMVHGSYSTDTDIVPSWVPISSLALRNLTRGFFAGRSESRQSLFHFRAICTRWRTIIHRPLLVSWRPGQELALGRYCPLMVMPPPDFLGD